MPTPSRLKTRYLEAKALSRILPHMPRLLPKSRLTLALCLDLRAERQGDSAAIKYQDEVISWGELRRRVNRCARMLSELGVSKGDKVVLLMDNRPDFIVYLLALSRLQAVAVLLNTSITGKSLAHCINIAESRYLVVGAEHLDKISPVLDQLEGVTAEQVWLAPDPEATADPAGDYQDLSLLLAEQPQEVDSDSFPASDSSIMDVCCYIYTSGTTGLPKAAIVSNQRIIASGALFARVLFDLKSSDTMYIASPLYHSMALCCGFGGVLHTGACLAMRRRFSASEFWDDIRRYDANAFTYIGELCRYLVNQPPRDDDRDHPLRTIGGVGLRPDVWRQFVERFGIAEVREMYGATEGSGGLFNITGRIGMLGRRQKSHSILRCDLATGVIYRNPNGFCEEIAEGETGLLVNRISVLAPFDGYVDKQASEKKMLRDVFKKGDCYFDTGDLVSLHDDGWLAFADRVGDTFRWKGENVSTNEVAETIDGCAGVLEANVYGVEVPGNEGRAGMASLNINEDFQLEDLAQRVNEELTSYQRPYFLRLQREMRLTQTFKHQKVDYRKEGFDPAVIEDPLYVLLGGEYVALDAPLFDKINSGEVALR